MDAMGNITISHRSDKSYRKYKSENRANRKLQIYQKWDQVPRRSKHSCWPVTSDVSPTSRSEKVTIHIQNQCIKNGLTVGRTALYLMGGYIGKLDPFKNCTINEYAETLVTSTCFSVACLRLITDRMKIIIPENYTLYEMFICIPLIS
jgi:hypothetical protein